MVNKIFELIEKYDSIVLFRHPYPDMDALGSQFGFATWLKERFPSKQVYCTGSSSALSDALGLTMDDVYEDVYPRSLGILLDISTSDRVDDENWKSCAQTIRIDHHVLVGSFCDVEWIDANASATCEMLGLFLKERQESLSYEACNLLYCGLIADNIRFTTNNVRKESFEAAEYLFSQGVDVVRCEQINFSSSYDDFSYETLVRSKSIRKENFLYSIMEQEDYVPVVKTFSSAKEKVYALSGIQDIEIWALFTRMDDGLHYSASLRSKTIDVRDIAQKFEGGGHACACGIKNLSREQVDEIVSLLEKRSLDKKA